MGGVICTAADCLSGLPGCVTRLIPDFAAPYSATGPQSFLICIGAIF
jgi:hypothetical protein